MENSNICHCSLFNIALRLYTILQLLFLEGTRLGAKPVLGGVFPRFFFVHTFHLHFELWELLVGQLGSNSEWIRTIFPPQSGGTTAAFMSLQNIENAFK